MTNKIPELNYLIEKVETKYGRKLASTTDFEALSVIIDRETGELVSASTLKRIWGYVTLKPQPRAATLDILARFLGKRDFQTFCKDLQKMKDWQSTFFTTKVVNSADLTEGQIVEIGWNPNRCVKLEYRGNGDYVVKESINSRLKVNDKFRVTAFMKGYPLFIPRILRDGEYTPSYVAGTVDGLTYLEVIGTSSESHC